MDAGIAFQIRDDVLETVDSTERRINGETGTRVYSGLT